MPKKKVQGLRTAKTEKRIITPCESASQIITYDVRAGLVIVHSKKLCQAGETAPDYPGNEQQ